MKKFICLQCKKEFYGYGNRKFCSIMCCGKYNNKYDKYIGKKIGLLTIIKKDDNNLKYKNYICKCECGNIKSISITNIITKRTKSCGCLAKKVTSELKPHTKHKKSNTRIYRIWSKMKNRCNNSNYFQYYLYGGRGIKVCDEWINNFENFYNWSINNGYKENLTLDRIDVNRNYEPSNCRWVSYKVQGRNKRNNIKITYNNEIHCISEWAEILNIKKETLYWRYKNKKNIKDIFKEV